MSDNGFLRQFDIARDEARKLARTTPYIFPEWQRMEQAKAKLKAAQAELAAAKKAWNSVGAKR